MFKKCQRHCVAVQSGRFRWNGHPTVGIGNPYDGYIRPLELITMRYHMEAMGVDRPYDSMWL